MRGAVAQTVADLSSAPPITMQASFSERRAALRARIDQAAQRAGRDSARVQLVAVAKTADEASLREAWEAGHRHYGHNRVQALLPHHAVLPDANWHLIGPLQRNKARKAVERVAMIETVAEARLAETLDRLAGELRTSPLPILLQLNLTPEDGRPGVPMPAAAGLDPMMPLLEALQPLHQLELRGLMTVAAATEDAESLRPHFARLRGLADSLVQKQYLRPDPELSMGMSGDFEIAVEEGATLVRLGRALFPPTETT